MLADKTLRASMIALIRGQSHLAGDKTWSANMIAGQGVASGFEFRFKILKSQ
jgi:hypothetical protein